MRIITIFVAAILLPLGAAVVILLTDQDATAGGVLPAGDLVYVQGTYAVRLTEQPCGDDDYRLQLENDGIPPARRSEVTSGSRRYSGCYARTIDGDILTLDYLATEPGTLPKEGFKPMPRL